jgi:hypothetical protein
VGLLTGEKTKQWRTSQLNKYFLGVREIIGSKVERRDGVRMILFPAGLKPYRLEPARGSGASTFRVSLNNTISFSGCNWLLVAKTA